MRKLLYVLLAVIFITTCLAVVSCHMLDDNDATPALGEVTNEVPISTDTSDVHNKSKPSSDSKQSEVNVGDMYMEEYTTYREPVTKEEDEEIVVDDESVCNVTKNYVARKLTDNEYDEILRYVEYTLNKEGKPYAVTSVKELNADIARYYTDDLGYLYVNCLFDDEPFTVQMCYGDTSKLIVVSYYENTDF